MRSSISSFELRDLARFFAECGLFAVLVFALHSVQYVLRASSDVPSVVQATREIVQNPDVDVLFLGDSSLFMGRPGEPDTRTTSEMLQSELSEFNVVEVSTEAAQMELYEMIAIYLSDAESAVRVVVVPLNLRLLAPQLEQRSYRYFDQERLYFENDSALFNILHRPLSVFKAFHHRSARADEFADAPVLDGDQDLGPLGEFNPAMAIPVSDTQRERIITFSYMYSLRRDDTSVCRLETLIDELQSAGIDVMLYLTPIDVDACRAQVGDQFMERVEANTDLLQQVALELGVQLVDLTDAVRREDFAWEHYPNEHLDAEGRMFVAKALANPIRHVLGESP